MPAELLIDACRERGLILAVAESCTGGLIAAALTGIPGASAVFDRGFVTYSNGAKCQMLGVPPALIERHGAVSREAALAMAEGALAHSQADLAAAVTGIAGPDGGTQEKPVGLIFIACAARGGTAHCEEHHFLGNREEIRAAAVRHALKLLHDLACQA